MGYEQLKLKADALFSEAPFISQIKTDTEYQKTLVPMPVTLLTKHYIWHMLEHIPKNHSPNKDYANRTPRKFI